MNNQINNSFPKHRNSFNWFKFIYMNIKIIFILTTLISTIYANDKENLTTSIKDGHFYLQETNYKIAIKHFNQALIKAKLFDYSKEITESSYFLALCYYKIKNLKKSLELVEESLFEIKNKDCDMLALILLLKACIIENQGNTNQAEIICNKILSLKNISSDNLVQTYLFMTKIYLNKKDLKNTAKYLNKIKKNLSKISNNKLKGWFFNENGQYHDQNNNFKEAIKDYQNMTIFYKKAGIPKQIAYGLELTAKELEKDKRYEEAVEHYFRSSRSYYAQNNQIKGNTNLNQAIRLIQYATKVLEKQINILTSKTQKLIK